MPKKSGKFTEKTKKLHRLLAILRILDNRKNCTTQTLAGEFETTTRSIFRDIKDLNVSGFSIIFDKECNKDRRIFALDCIKDFRLTNRHYDIINFLFEKDLYFESIH